MASTRGRRMRQRAQGRTRESRAKGESRRIEGGKKSAKPEWGQGKPVYLADAASGGGTLAREGR
eukprot:5337811-Pleurochrysis_carterae.AAC.1